MIQILQINWFIDPSPSTVPIWLIALGLQMMFLSFIYEFPQNVDGFQQLTGFEKTIAWFGLGMGYFFLTLSVIRQGYSWYAVFLFLLFRGVEGVIAVHLYKKIYIFLEGKGYEGDLISRSKHLLGIWFVTLLGGYLIIKALIETAEIGGFGYSLSLAYTGTVAIGTILGVRWKYRDVANEINDGVVIGLGFCIAGSQIFGFTLVNDILLSLTGSIIYSIAYWKSALYTFENTSIGENSNSSNPTTCKNCNNTVDNKGSPEFCPYCGDKM